MRNQTIVISTFIFFFCQTSSAQKIDKEFLYSPSASSVAISNDSLLAFYQSHHLSLLNNYIPKDSCFMMLGKIVQKLNEVYIFDSLHQRLVFYSGLKCVYNKRLLSSSQFEKTPVETNTSVYDSIMNFVHPISSVLLAQKKYTAIIIWNMKLGIKQDDNFIEWETILNNLYKDNINIIKINYDSNQSYQEPYKHQISKMFNDFYSAYTGAVNSMNDK